MQDIIQDGTKLHKAIKDLGVARQKLDDQVQHLALSAIWHFGVRADAEGRLIGDVGFINRLYLSLGKGARHVAFTAWVTKYGAVKANDGPGKNETPFVKDKGKIVDMDGGAKEKWFDMKPSNPPDECLDYYSLLLKVVNKEAKPSQTVKGAELAHKIKTMVQDAIALDKAEKEAEEETRIAETERVLTKA